MDKTVKFGYSGGMECCWLIVHFIRKTMKMEVHKMIGSLGASGREGAGRLDIRAEVGVELAGWMSGVLATPFFRNICGEREGEAALLQAMYLMDGRDSGRNYSPLGDYAEMAEYCHEARGDYTARKRGIIQCLAEYLSEAFPEGSPGVRAEHVPMLVLFADTAMRHGVVPGDFGGFVVSLGEVGD